MVKARIILSLFFLFDLLVYFSSIWFGNYFTRSVFKFIPDIWSLSPLKAKSRTMGERQTYLLWQRFTTFQLNLFIIMSYRNIFFRKRWLFRARRLISLPLSNVLHVAGLQRRRCPHLHDSSRQRHKKIATSERNVLGDFFLLHVYIFICL